MMINMFEVSTSERTVVIFGTATARNETRTAVVSEEAGNASAHHLPTLTVAHATRVVRIHQLFSVPVDAAFLFAF